MTAGDLAYFRAPAMAAVFAAPALVQRALDFEAALARAQAAVGVIPAGAAEAIAARCRADLFDVPALVEEAAASGTLAVPLVRVLGGLVEPSARGFVHWGATSQDVLDTAMVLQVREGLDVLERGLRAVGQVCAGLAHEHRRTVMAGRTLLQHAVPITFGLKAARWLALVVRLVGRLREARGRVLVVQLGGAAGTLAALGPDGPRVMELVARALGLGVPDLPWHAERDRVGEVGAALGLVAGAAAKVAGDLALLSQTEVGEISTGAQAGAARSSTMPQKRNPVEPTFALANARLALGMASTVLAAWPAQEHERAAGGWQAEWAAVPELFERTAAAVDWVRRALDGLVVDAGRMRANLAAGGGQIMAEALTMALAGVLGREVAYRVVQRVCDTATRAGLPLERAAAADEEIRAALPADQLVRALAVEHYLGSTDAFIDRALEEFRRLPG
ncbi:MAG: adenylosuccinate lyase family protein [Armatimonadota bacterium]|nr:adenylosuccinate lyase family protein [Armatimonadota bacterium]MDR7534429.1 adenylosuccinate lyase family protein [Armatimonadota bacterium]MDR7535722.1 adenylosuccinate lyase family protein [Armatimonadota bacterium]